MSLFPHAFFITFFHSYICFIFFDTCLLSAFSNSFSVIIERTFSSPAFTTQHGLLGFSAICLAFLRFIDLSTHSSLNATHCLSWDDMVAERFHKPSGRYLQNTLFWSTRYSCVTSPCSHVSGESSCCSRFGACAQGPSWVLCSVGTNHLDQASYWRRSGPSCVWALSRPVARSSGICPGIPASLSHHWEKRKNVPTTLL